jgi:hypothetical protein
MEIKNYLMRFLGGVLVISSFVMCTKSVTPIEKPVTPDPGNSTELPANGTEATVGCTYTVKTSDWFVDGTNIPAGSVICIPAGTRGALLLKNFKGTAANPLLLSIRG